MSAQGAMHQVQGVNFSFYTEKELEALSVCQVTSSSTYDQLGNCIQGGLYSPEMGPATMRARNCSTCGLSFRECPGHFGHIKLCVPVWNPQLFNTLYRLLRYKCFNCNRLKHDRMAVQTLIVQIQLIQRGKALDALKLQEKLEGRDGNADPENTGQRKQRIKAVLRSYERSIRNLKPLKRLHIHDKATLNRLIKEFWAKSPAAHQPCRNCGAYSPGLRKVGHLQLFLKPIPAKHKRSNDLKGIFMKEFDAGKSKQTKKRKKRRRNSDDGSSSSSSPDSEDGSSSSSSEAEQSDASQDTTDDGAETKGSEKGKPVTKSILLSPLKAEALLKLLFVQDGQVLSLVFPGATVGSFFIKTVPVVPSRFRPPAVMGDMTYEHPLNITMTRILNANEQLLRSQQLGEAPNANGTRRTMNYWADLVDAVNSLIDSTKNVRDRPIGGKDPPAGLRQVLEKKEGLFRRNMMGKRVNYAARSVISPDLYIDSNEVGVPLKFAKGLSYPTVVTAYNVEQLRKAVQNGPDIHPGANFVEDEWGHKTDLARLDAHQRNAISQTLLTKSSLAPPGSSKKVMRHLINGDALILNRQPSLHKPSMMAHVARILPNPKWQTIRMHYANCNSYNADFDGDEINMHCPQGELARSESYNIAQTSHQYIVPTDGSPLRGLIQDHVGAGVLLTKRDTFFTRDQYFQFLATVSESIKGGPSHVKPLPPCILKPQELWSGKQIISTLLCMLMYDETDPNDRSKDLPRGSWLNMDGKAKLNPSMGWGKKEEEHLILVRENQLLRGVLDKSQFGSSAYGLVHCFYELYGSRKTELLLTALGRLFTLFLQHMGAYTCGLEDMVLTMKADSVRKAQIEASVKDGVNAIKSWIAKKGKNQEDGEEDGTDDAVADMPVEEAIEEAIKRGLSGEIDAVYKSVTMPAASDIIKTALPGGLRRSFPINNLSLMVLTGAKGSLVNHSQISCLLGQQELEGKRVPVMVSGKTLPAFPAYDPRPRAGGFITDRFLTGVRPQDYYFHCMSGREGLVDTAVKTSRSGYLQRCIVKHMEDLNIAYDRTVRDADGSCIQFMYGADGLDPTKVSLLTGESRQMKLVALNTKALLSKHVTNTSAAREAFGNSTLASKIYKFTDQAISNDANTFKEGDIVEAKRPLSTPSSRYGNWTDTWHPARVTKSRKKDTYDIEFLDFKVGDTVKLSKHAFGEKTKGKIQRKIGSCLYSVLPENGKNQKVVGVDMIDHGVIAKRMPHAIPPATARHEDDKKRKGIDLISMSDRRLIRHAKLDPPTFGNLSVDLHLGAVSEAFRDRMKTFCADDANVKMLEQMNLPVKQFEQLLYMMNMKSLADPGEAVGCLAAQSIGEPSTQMTLNTFHLAGTGMANVTLGIPRLREIVMSASADLKTPVMAFPIRSDGTEKGNKMAEKAARTISSRLRRVSISELLDPRQAVTVIESVVYDEMVDKASREYRVVLNIADIDAIQTHFGIKMDHIVNSVRAVLTRKILKQIKAVLRLQSDIGSSTTAASGNPISDTKKKNEAAMQRNRADSVAEEPTYDSEVEESVRNNDEDASPHDGEGEDSRAKPAHAVATVNIPKRNKWKGIPSDVLKSPYFHSVELKKGNRVELVFQTPVRAKKLLMLSITESCVEQVFVRETASIRNAFPLYNKKEKRWQVHTEGVNFEAVWNLKNAMVDLQAISTNDIAAMSRTYGAEAGRACLIQQILSVFGVYGITIDSRHLCLVADYMFHTGKFVGMNRIGIKETKSSSPFQKMSFETCATFLTNATVAGESDNLTSPSSQIVLGRVAGLGTGGCDVMVDYERMVELGEAQVLRDARRLVNEKQRSNGEKQLIDDSNEHLNRKRKK